MKLNQLKPIVKTAKKRLGRGYGSGKGGHTSSRGQKGQKSRSKLPLYFEGTAMRKSLIRRLPMMPGKSKNRSYQAQSIILNLKYLNGFKAKTIVDLAALVKAGLVNQQEAGRFGVKILGDGELKVALIVKLPTSKSAAKKIEAAGGKVVPAGVSLNGIPTRQKSTGKAKSKKSAVKKTSVIKKPATKKPAVKSVAKKKTVIKKAVVKKTTKTKKVQAEPVEAHQAEPVAHQAEPVEAHQAEPVEAKA